MNEGKDCAKEWIHGERNALSGRLDESEYTWTVEGWRKNVYGVDKESDRWAERENVREMDLKNLIGALEEDE